MNLNDLRPKEVDFELCGLALTFRPISIADDFKAQDICGGLEGMKVVFDKWDFKKISLIAWYQLTFKSQEIILNQVGDNYIDPISGEKIGEKLTPLDKFRKIFVGVGDQIQLVVNLNKCKGLNIPSLDDTETLKKWVDQSEEALKSTGL